MPASRRACLFLLVAGLAACARLPAEEAAGTPAAALAAQGFAAVVDPLSGAPIGAAVAVGPGLVATAGHVMSSRSEVRLRRGDGAWEGPAHLLHRSATSDLAFLVTEAGALAPVGLSEAAMRPGQPVWALGAPGLGRPVATGEVQVADALLPGFGRGFTARMPALMGYSGGPVLGADGRLLGLTSALPEPGAAVLLSVLTGADLDGLARRTPREVFVLGVAAVRAELERLDLAQGRRARAGLR